MPLPERIIAKESVRAMENKPCPESDEPVKLSFKRLKEITDNFAEQVGYGASAQVYKGVFNGEVIAVKKLPFKIGIGEKQFQNEYEHLKTLKHRNIVRLVGFCDEIEHVEAEYDGQTVIALSTLINMIFTNCTFHFVLAEKYPGLSWRTRFQIIKGMCVGLKYIHEASVVHLDIKPGNILLDAKMIPKIVDFGISRLLSEECIREAKETHVGTIGYVPPEFIDNQFISRGFDIFSLGVTIEKIVAGVMDNWNSSYMNDKEEYIDYVHDNWKKRFEEIPRYHRFAEHCQQVRACIEIALQCMDDDQLKRPSVNQIVNKLIRLQTTGWSAFLSEDSWFPVDIPEMPSPGIEDSHIRICELPFEFLREITNNFSKERIVIESSSATVFKGIVNSGEETVVKRFRGSKKEVPDNVFQNAVGKLMEIKHKNIVRLLGYCNEKKREVVKLDGRYIVTCKVETLLWYEYVPNRSLDQYIYGYSCQLDWNMRFKIILAICEALHFLHTELNRPISHLPLTPENILLNKNMVPKLSDIGLSDLFDGLSPEGTEYDPEINRYKAPEYINRYTISFQSDIYSLGLLIMDIATGEKDNSHARQTMDSSHFVNVHRKWTDEYIASKYTSLDVTCIGQLKVCLQIAVWCVQDKRKDRPSIREIVNALNNPYLGTTLNKPGVTPILSLSVQPRRLSFPLVPTRLTSRLLCLTNNKDELIAFRLVTDNPGRYHTEMPLCGVVPPKRTYTINMIVRKQTKQLPWNSDEFLTLMCITAPEKELKSLDTGSIAVLFENADHEVQEMMLPVVCDPPEGTTSDQIVASQNCRVVMSVDLHPTSQNYRQVLSMDVHPKEPWILTTNQRGTLCIWNYQKKETVNSFEVSPGEPVYSAKFIERKHWLITGDGDGYIHVYNYDTMEEVRNFKAHENNIMSLALHPTSPFVLSASDDHLIKLWDWDKSWEYMQTFRGHYNRVTQVMFHPLYSKNFASASLDGRVKIWNFDSGNCTDTFDEHPDGLLCLHYFAYERNYHLVVGSSDSVAKVWYPEAELCVGTLEGHTNCITSLCWQPKHEVIVTGSLDGTIQIWKPTGTRYRLDNIIGLNLGAVTALAYIQESTRVVVGCEQGIAMVDIDYP